MPQLASAVKRLHRSEKRRVYNLRIKNAIGKLKKVLLKNGTTDSGLWKTYLSLVDRATRKGVLKTNTAARMKSRLWKKLAASRP